MKRGVALALLLAGCARQAAAPPPTAMHWEIGRVQGRQPACYARLVEPNASHAYFQLADGTAAFAITAREGKSMTDLLGGRPLPPVGAPFPYPSTPAQPQIGTVIDSSERRLAVRLLDPARLSALMNVAESESMKQASPDQQRNPPNTVARLADCLKTIQPAGASPQ
jgi:hypothetical protein